MNKFDNLMTSNEYKVNESDKYIFKAKRAANDEPTAIP
jgi:hypothetical protein